MQGQTQLIGHRDAPARKREQDAVGGVSKRDKLLCQQFTGLFTVFKHDRPFLYALADQLATP